MVETVRYYQNITVIVSTQLLQYIIDFPFKGVHNYQGMLLERVTFASFGVFQVRKNQISLCLTNDFL